MAQGDEAREFIQDGLFRYAAARATVLSFEEAVREEVAEIVARSAAPLVKRRASLKVEDPSVCNGDAGGRVACCQFAGEFRSDAVRWELGVWWQDPSKGDEVVVYAECVEGPRYLTQKVWAKVPSSPGYEWTAYRGGINLVIKPNDNLAQAFKLLIREVARQGQSAAR